MIARTNVKGILIPTEAFLKSLEKRKIYYTFENVG